MSTSNYQSTTTTSTNPGMGRTSYGNQDYNRGPNSNYRDVDQDARHHGRWTASSESRDFSGDSSSRGGMGGMFGRSSSDRDSSRDRDYDRDFDRSRDRDYDRSRDYDRNRESFDRSRIPVPPPMPPTGYMSGFDSYYQPGSGLSHLSGYGSPYESSSHYGSSFPQHYPMSHPSLGHSSYGSHPSAQYGMGSSSFPSSFPHYGMGAGFPHYGSSMGTSSYGSHPSAHYGSSMGSSSFGMPQHHYGPTSGMGLSSGYGMGMPQHYGSSSMTGSRSLRSSGTTPEVDIYEVGNDYIIELDLPGHSREHIDTKLFGNELLITSKPPRRTHDFHMNERSLGHTDVSRRLYLPPDAESSKINASLTNGVLKIAIPRSMATSTTGAPSQTTIVVDKNALGQTGATHTMAHPTTHSTVTPSTTLIKDTVTTTTETKRV